MRFIAFSKCQKIGETLIGGDLLCNQSKSNHSFLLIYTSEQKANA